MSETRKQRKQTWQMWWWWHGIWHQGLPGRVQSCPWDMEKVIWRRHRGGLHLNEVGLWALGCDLKLISREIYCSRHTCIPWSDHSPDFGFFLSSLNLFLLICIAAREKFRPACKNDPTRGYLNMKLFGVHQRGLISQFLRNFYTTSGDFWKNIIIKVFSICYAL